MQALLAVPPKEIHQILEKINMLTQDPTPDAKVKKQLKYLNGKLHRIRCGDYRIFYTFEHPYISILALRRRDDDTYDEDFDVEFLGGLDPQFDATYPAKTAQPDWEHFLAAELTRRGVEATFMASHELNLTRPGVKVLTLNSAKGLEFPIVALSGFSDSPWYTGVPKNFSAEERDEHLAVDRRIMFVGMTRAMRALLITIPSGTKGPLLEGFDAAYWNLGG